MTETEQHDLQIGKNKKNEFKLSYETRMQNTVVYGIKGSGKTKYILPMMANEQLANKDEGATFIVEKQEIGWLISELAEKHGREVIFLNPSINEGMKTLIDLGMSKQTDIKEKVIDYADAMKNKKIVIIDSEAYKYHENAAKAVKKLLYYFQSTMYSNTPETPHFVYIDDAEQYLPNIESLLTYGEQFGIGTILFLQSHSIIASTSAQLGLFLDVNVRTTILANAMLYEDYNYFNTRFFGAGTSQGDFMLNRPYETLICETIVNGKTEVSIVDVKYLSEKIIRETYDVIEIRKIKASKEPMKKFSDEIDEDEEMAKTSVKPKKKKKNQYASEKKEFKPVLKTTKVFLDEKDFNLDF